MEARLASHRWDRTVTTLRRLCGRLGTIPASSPTTVVPAGHRYVLPPRSRWDAAPVSRTLRPDSRSPHGLHRCCLSNHHRCPRPDPHDLSTQQLLVHLPALPLGSAPLDGGESGPYGCRHKLLLRNRYLRYIPDDDVDPDECPRDDLCAGGRGCEAVDGLASVLIGGEGDQCPAPLSDPRSPEGDELSRLALTQPRDGELVSRNEAAASASTTKPLS